MVDLSHQLCESLPGRTGSTVDAWPWLGVFTHDTSGPGTRKKWQTYHIGSGVPMENPQKIVVSELIYQLYIVIPYILCWYPMKPSI